MAGNTNQASTMPAIGWNTVGYQPFGAGQTNTVFNFGKKDSKDMYNQHLQRQNKLDSWNLYMQAGTSAVNAIGNITSMALNYSLQNKYLTLQETIADNQFKLGNRGMDLEFKKLEVQQRMGKENMTHQRRIARIQSQTAIAISSIQQKGKTKRAEVFAAMNAFHRSNYQYGTPTFQTSVMS